MSTPDPTQQAAEVAKQIAAIRSTPEEYADKIAAIIAHEFAGKDKRIHDLEVEALGLKGGCDGLMRTFETWQEQAAQLAAEFPGVEWTHCHDLIPHVRSLRAANAALAAEVERLRGDFDNERKCCLGLGRDVVDLEKDLARLRADKEAADGLLREAEEGLGKWTYGYAEESDKIVCSCCERQMCRPDCQCWDLVNRLNAYLKALTPPTAQTEEGKT